MFGFDGEDGFQVPRIYESFVVGANIAGCWVPSPGFEREAVPSVIADVRHACVGTVSHPKHQNPFLFNT